MQQLLGDKTEAKDTSLLKGLFIQRLPSNVRMILASTAKVSNLLELGEMDDKCDGGNFAVHRHGGYSTEY